MMAMKKCKLGDLFSQRKERGINGLPVLSVTMDQGVVRRDSLGRRMTSVLSAEDHLLVKAGDVVFNMMRMWQGAVGVVSEDGIVSPAYVVCVPQKDVNPIYMYYQFKSARVLKKLNDYSQGITDDRLRLYFQHFAEVPILIHSKPEQDLLADVFCNWDSAIRMTERAIAKKQERYTWLMHQLLTGIKRLPGFEIQPWKECHLGEVFKERREKNCQPLPLLSITASRGVILQEETDKKDNSNADKSSYKRIAPGDIGYNTMRMWQGVSALSTSEGLISPAYTVCIPRKGIFAEYARHLFKFPPTIHLFWRYSQGLVDDTLNLKFNNFAQVKVKLPDIPEQRKIAEVLDAAVREIEQLQKQLEALRVQKKGLMQQLLTGLKRVN